LSGKESLGANAFCAAGRTRPKSGQAGAVTAYYQFWVNFAFILFVFFGFWAARAALIFNDRHELRGVWCFGHCL
jgi:hypothetical protein